MDIERETDIRSQNATDSSWHSPDGKQIAWARRLWKSPAYGPITRYVKLRVAHAPGKPGTFSPPPRGSDPDMHHGTCVTHGPWCMPGSPTSGFIWSRWRGNRSRHSRRMRNPQFYVSGKRPIVGCLPLSPRRRFPTLLSRIRLAKPENARWNIIAESIY